MKPSTAPIGFLGDGQLALMLGESAQAQGIAFLAFGDNPDSSFAKSFPEHFIQGDPTDIDDLTAFAVQCKAITLENEFFKAEDLAHVEEDSGTPIIPSPRSYKHFESKLAQRAFYRSLGLAEPKWMKADPKKEKVIAQITEHFAYPVVLKANRGGYDGYGVRVVKQINELKQALIDLKHSEADPVLIEEKVAIRKEFAQGGLFDGNGNVVLLPLVETVQKNGICELVLSRPTLPANELEVVSEKISAMMDKIAKSRILGLFSFEFFYTDSGDVVVNEGAPRPHNSQHLSIDASPVSQFDLLVQFLKTLRLPDVKSPVPSKPGVMINLLGKSEGQDYQLGLPELPDGIVAHPKLYLKKESRIGRKMGHLNLIDESGTHNLVEIGERLLKDYTL